MRFLILISLLTVFGDLFSQGNPIDKQPISDFHFSDTTINQFRFVFTELGEHQFGDLKRQLRTHDITLDKTDRLVVKKDSSLIIKLQNDKFDTLKNHRDQSGYFESYEVAGLWKNRNQVVVHYSNWEEGNDLLIDLRDGLMYALAPIYKLSSEENFLFCWTNASEQPIYSGGFSIAGFLNGKLRTIFNANLNQATITEAFWLGDRNCLIMEGKLGSDYKIANYHYFELKITNAK